MPDVKPLDAPSTGGDSAAQRGSTGSFYRPELDGLRFFCFLAVFIGHSCPINPLRQPIASPAVRELYSWLWSIPQAGDVGVDAFFTLSSFLITELLLREWEQMGRIDVGAFYCRRALRIWPLYYTFLLLAVLIEPQIGLRGLPPGFLAADAAFVGNWMMAWTGIVPQSATQILWTISIEEQFYLLWPLLIWACGPRRIGHLALATLTIAMATRFVLVACDAPPMMIANGTFSRMDGIACGALAAVVLRRWPLDLSQFARCALLAAGVILPVATHRWLRLSPPFPGTELLTFPLMTLAAVLLLLGALRPSADRGSMLTHPSIVYLGKISYGLYVWHLACILAVCKLGWSRPGEWITPFFALALTIGVATASYYVLELPFLRFKRAFTRIPSRDDALEPGPTAPFEGRVTQVAVLQAVSQEIG